MRAGIYLIVLVSLILLFWKCKPRVILVSILCLLGGYFYAMMHISFFERQRADIGDMVGWHASNHTLEGTAGNLISTSEFAHRYRMRVTLIDDKQTSFDVALSLPPNLSVLPGDLINAVGTFSFPKDTPTYMAEKQLWNQ